jgi:hypothetical protein
MIESETLNVRQLGREYAAYAAAEALEYLRENRDHGDYSAEEVREVADDHLWQSVDGCADVIYYNRAWRVVASDPQAAQDAYAEIMGDAFPRDAESLDAAITTLAFAVIYRTAQEYLDDAIANAWNDDVDGDA